MAYLVKDARGRSPYWSGVYRIVEPDGSKRWVRKSTEKTKRSDAKEIVDQWQKTADQAAAGLLTDARVRKIILETVERVTGKRVNTPTVRLWLNQWLKTEKDAVTASTLERYEQISRDFMACIGKKADAPLEALSTEDVIKFKDERLADGLSPRTVNQTVKILKRPFKLALDEGRIDRNPVAAIRSMRATAARKGVFSPEQITKLVDAAAGDWKGLILAGYFTGGRLTDLARLKWQNVDLVEKTIAFSQKKTGAPVKIPIHPELEEHLIALPSSDKLSKPVFPELHDKPGSGKSGLSMSFKRVMAKAGIADGVAREKSGKLGRNVSSLSFHSLRHSFNSAMANAGVSPEIRQLLTGHASGEMNKIYTHHELEVVRKAIQSISKLKETNE
jgi:integrase